MDNSHTAATQGFRHSKNRPRCRLCRGPEVLQPLGAITRGEEDPLRGPLCSSCYLIQGMIEDQRRMLEWEYPPRSG